RGRFGRNPLPAARPGDGQRRAAPPVRPLRAHRRTFGELAARPRSRCFPLPHAQDPGTAETGRLHAVRHRRRAHKALGDRGGTAQGHIVTGGWKRALVLAPHTDDGEFGCGGTMARLVEEGVDVRYVAFSIATRSLPGGFPPDTLRHEV